MRYVNDKGIVIDVKSPIRGAKWRPLDAEAKPEVETVKEKPAKKSPKSKK